MPTPDRTATGSSPWWPGAADGPLVGYAQVDDAGGRSDAGMELVAVGPHARSLRDQLLDAALGAYRSSGGGRLRLWVTHATGEDDERAAGRGFAHERDLFQLRCDLPLPHPDGTHREVTVTTRPFRVGHDEEAWLVCNNRAFADHPEQGRWDLATIRGREREPWFDPDGFLVLEAGGRMAGSCWTKVHADSRPPMGEIYVIGVDPDFHGLGWGRALTGAGLDHLAARGLRTGMLYVDSANGRAVDMYRSMGFTTDHVDRSYVREVDRSPAT